MMRCLSDKEIFDYIDRQLSQQTNENISTHAATCLTCQRRIRAIKELRAEASKVLDVCEPDWSQMEPAIEKFIWKETSSAQPVVFSLMPVALVAAAMVFIVAAFIPGYFHFSDSWFSNSEPGLADTSFAKVAFNSSKPLKAFIVENLDRSDRLRVESQRIFINEPLNTRERGGIRLTIGDDTIIELDEKTTFEITSLDPDEPSVKLKSGTFLAGVSEGQVEQKLIVMAGEVIFSVLSGKAEFFVSEGHLAVRVICGKVIEQSDQQTSIMPVGSWILANQKEGKPAWVTGVFPRYRESNIKFGSIGTSERNIHGRTTGTIPRFIIHESFNRIKPQLKRCYELALKRNPSLMLNLEAKVKLNVKGEIFEILIIGADEQLQIKECLVDIFSKLNLPAPSGGGIELIFPLHFSPRF